MRGRGGIDRIPVLSRTQRRFERRQRLLMLILAAAVTVASFFLGVMVGERRSATELARQIDAADPATAQAPAPPLPAGQYSAPQKLTFYEDLPKGNAAPLGSGINLPKASAPAASPPVPSAPAAAVSIPPSAGAPQAKPAPTPAIVPPKASGSGGFIVQVASTKNQAEAQRLADKLSAKGFAASSERADLGARGIWYRVVTGPYPDQAAADQAAAHLKKQKFAAMVRKR